MKNFVSSIFLLILGVKFSNIADNAQQYKLLDTNSMFNMGWKPNKSVEIFRSNRVHLEEIDNMIERLKAQVFKMN